MVMLWLVALGVVLAAAAFVLAPLFRREEDLKSIRRPRPGMRHLHGLDSVEVQLRETNERQCPHCGAAVHDEFTFCGHCCKPLP